MPLRVAALALFSLLALAGCGATSSQDVSSQNDSETPAPKDTLLAPTATIIANQVTLTTDRVSYKPGDQVRVIIANGQGANVYAIATNANCTPVAVQVRIASSWQAANVSPCGAQGDPQTVEIKPGSATSVTIIAPAAGTYRCALQYTTITIPPPRNVPPNAVGMANSANGPGVTVYSAQWDVTTV
jgi:uncharacterized cupredoxin-like copper-binding protein